MSTPGEPVRIHYRRIPDREQVFHQRVVEVEGDGTVVTLSEAAPVPRPVRAGEAVILDPGAPAVWLTFPGVWHDIGRFHRADGTFTGYYANILTPPAMAPGVWDTTDLFLDVWLPADGAPVILLDEEEFEDARSRGLLDAATAGRARGEAERLIREAQAGSWPPAAARRWTLEAARAHLAHLDATGRKHERRGLP